jgi:transglutaminase-like putative cysteine protease
MKLVLLIFILFCSVYSNAQYEHGFPYGKINQKEFELSDTSVSAIILNEFGEAYIDNTGENNLLLEYHVKIKILTKQGLDRANFEIPLRKGERSKETIRSVEGVTYNLVNNAITTARFDSKQVFTTNLHKYRDAYKFTMPSVMVGSIIEVRYTLESPFIFNFWPWKFQSDIPKLKSEFWARIPGNYVYNMSLQGFLKLQMNESSLIGECFTPGSNRADCALYKYSMINIPAFEEEDYMTASNNFISGINFELSEIKHFDGRVIKYTKTWRDVDKELNTDENFGTQIRKGKNIWSDKVAGLSTEIDPLKKASSIYEMIRDGFIWNGVYGKYTDEGLKKAFESRKGNIGDINLSLVAALQEAGLSANPIILATREVRLPNQLYPVISDFNYVIASVDINGERYLLDASDHFLPFGLLPERCLNGSGRLISKKEEESGWVDIKPREKQKQQITLTLTLNENTFKGDLSIVSSGYEAYDKRKAIGAQESIEKYKDKMQQNIHSFQIVNYELENFNDLSKPLIETLKVESTLELSNPNILYLNPFFIERWEQNPFKSNQRLYPVDFGAPMESIFILNLDFPDSYLVDEVPESVAVALPQSGGKFLVNITNRENKISLTSIINLSKVVYSSAEYHALKELFNRIVQMQQSQIVLKKK